MRIRALIAALFCCLCGSAWAQSYPTPALQLGFALPTNIQINTSVGSSALTITVKGAAASYSASNTGLFAFRDSTLASGAPVIVGQQSNLTFTIGSTDTMGCVNSQMCRLRIYAINNAGTIGLCAYNSLNGSTLTIVGLSESNVQSSASGTSGGSSAQTLYCSISSVSSKSIRELRLCRYQRSYSRNVGFKCDRNTTHGAERSSRRGSFSRCLCFERGVVRACWQLQLCERCCCADDIEYDADFRRDGSNAAISRKCFLRSCICLYGHQYDR